jgi:hypothetical protein
MNRNTDSKLCARRMVGPILISLPFLLLLGAASAKQNYWLTVNHGGPGGSECIENPREKLHAYMIGMTGSLIIHIDYPDSMNMPYRGIQDWTWPQGMTIEAGISDDTVTSHYQSSGAVLNRLNLTYFVDWLLVHQDSLWRHEGIIPRPEKMFRQPTFWFHFDMDEGWVGKYLCFRVRYDHPVYGNLVSDVKCFRVCAPCTKADSSLVRLGNISAVGDMCDFTRALAMTDSLLAIGWMNREVLNYARRYAMKLRRFDDVLRYMDVQFQRYGNIWPEGGEEVHTITPDSRAKYEQFRQQILQAKTAYEQQQQQQQR